MLDLLTSAKTSLIIYPPEFESQALGRSVVADDNAAEEAEKQFGSSQVLTIGDRNVTDRLSFNSRGSNYTKPTGLTFGPVVTTQNGDLAIQVG